MTSIQIKTVPATEPDLLQLISRLDAELIRRYSGQADLHAVDFNAPNIGDINFAVAYVEGVPAGCGALRPYDGECIELKRFFVEPAYRGKGIATAILKYLEAKAAELGYGMIKLETGPEQPEAIRLYQKFGYYEIEKYGEYIGDEFSICFEKLLPAKNPA